jgi:hypothetical protein
MVMGIELLILGKTTPKESKRQRRARDDANPKARRIREQSILHRPPIKHVQVYLQASEMGRVDECACLRRRLGREAERPHFPLGPQPHQLFDDLGAACLPWSR